MDIIMTEKAPKAAGPYSQAVRAGGFVFTAGQIGLTPQGELVKGGAAAEARQALLNIKAVLEAAGTSLQNVVKVTLYLEDIADFAAVNAVYAEFFPVKCPARSTVQAALVKGAKVEIDAIAVA